MKAWISSLCLMLPLCAQVPEGWNQRTSLGSEVPGKGLWYGAGLWSGDHHGASSSLTDSLGMGNALAGNGFHLEAGYRAGKWDLAGEVLGYRDTEGRGKFALYRSHVWYRGTSGWQGGFEQEPLVWGYGLNGGYLLGEAARPFPRFRLESPMAALHLGRVPLGTWGFQVFIGRLEADRVLSSSIQDGAFRRAAIAAQGDPQAPFLNGFRIQSRFGPSMEFYLNYTNLWGGTLNGQAMTKGYGLGDYLTSIFGLKDTLAEASTDYANLPPGQPPPVAYRNKALSASNLDVGFRLELPRLARWLRSDRAWVYVSRGSKAVNWPVGLFVKRPFYYLGKDLNNDWTRLQSMNMGQVWNGKSRYAVPNLGNPNDAAGILVSWPRVRAGLEYFAPSNNGAEGHRTFAHGLYLTGFYYHGDPLGSAMGGEGHFTTAKVEVLYTSRLSGTTLAMMGERPFRDNLDAWAAENPGQTPAKNRVGGLQQSFAWKVGSHATLDLGAAWQHQGAVGFAGGRAGNGFRYYADLSYRWPGRR